MTPYTHKVAYYETDRMGITHHSNYIRWMEEARVDFLDQLGWSFARLEESGVSSPVLNVNCSYKRPTTFDDRVQITVTLQKLSKVACTFAYAMHKLEDGEPGPLVCEGTSDHCFVSAETGRPMRTDRQIPEFYALLQSYMEDAQG